MGSYAVIGGGISGLAAAHYLSKAPSTKKVILLEGSARLGGWIDTTRRTDGVILEHGPRTIRPAGPQGANTLSLVEELGLASKVRPVPKSHPAATNRMVYSGGRIHKLPSAFGLRTLLGTSGGLLSKPLILAGLKDLVMPAKVCQDDSLHNFASRRFGRDIADYLVDPFVRGICAGDSKHISASAFVAGPLFRMEQADGGVLRSAIKKGLGLSRVPEPEANLDGQGVALVQRSRAEKWSVWSLEGGLSTLVEGLVNHLDHVGKVVSLHVQSPVAAVDFNQGSPKRAQVRLQAGQVDSNGAQSGGPETNVLNETLKSVDHVFLAVPGYSAASMLAGSCSQLSDLLDSIPYVDVAVVNVEYEGVVPLPLGGEPAFGLLVPSSEMAAKGGIKLMGLIFDTCSFPQGTNRTIFTAMMGGAWFQQVFGTKDPDLGEVEEMALEGIESILGLAPSEWRPRKRAVVCKIQRRCIAQYTVGHRERLARVRSLIAESGLPISLIGSAFDGVGVNDAIMSSKRHVEAVLT